MDRLRSSPVVGAPSTSAWRLSELWPRATTALLVGTLGVAPIALLPSSSPVYPGIATATPTLYTYTIAVGLSLLALSVKAPRQLVSGLVPWIPLFVWLIALTLFVWGPTPRVLSGLLHLALGAVAFAIGGFAAGQDRDATRYDGAGWWAARLASLVPWLFAGVAWLQLAAVGVVAVLDRPLRNLPPVLALDLHNRVTGLTSHPGELAKLLFFCAMFALVLPHRARWERWLAWLTLGATLVGVYLTKSRAPLAGLVAMIGIYVVMDRAAGRWQRRHVVTLGMTMALALASIPWMIRRFSRDAGMEARRHVMGVALDVIRDRPWTGVGANNYVALVGPSDRLTATGVPVHNIFLLSAAEIGVIGALLLWLPFVVVSVQAVRRLRLSRGADPAARLIASALPGIGLIALTGWGLLQGPYFLIFAFVFGYFGSRAPGEDRARPRRAGAGGATSVGPADGATLVGPADGGRRPDGDD